MKEVSYCANVFNSVEDHYNVLAVYQFEKFQFII